MPQYESRITLATPRLGAEEGVGKTTKKKNTKKLQPRASVYRLDYPDPGPALSGGDRQDREKKNQTNKQKRPPQPSTERVGSVGRKKENAGTKLPSPVRQGTPQTLTLRFRKSHNHLRRKTLMERRRKHQKQPKEKDPGPKTQKLPETVQGEEPRGPKNCRARRRREKQLTTAAPRESSTLLWIPRENAGFVDQQAPRTSFGPR